MEIINILPNEIHLYIFKFLDWNSLKNVERVCKLWKDICDGSDTTLIKQKTECSVAYIIKLLEKINLLVLEESSIYENKSLHEHQSSPAAVLSLLRTIGILQDYFKAAHDDTSQEKFCMNIKTVIVPEYKIFTGGLTKYLREAICALGENVEEKIEMLDLMLSRHYHHFHSMFMSTGEISTKVKVPSDVIKDIGAREFWDKYIGPRCLCVDFDTFYNLILIEIQVSNKNLLSEKFKYYLKAFLNSPSESTMNVSKWNILTGLFGPYEKFYINFHRYVLGRGFLGMISRYTANDILINYPGHVLMRFSKTFPFFMAFSANKDGEITHRINRNADGTAVPIEQYFSLYFPGIPLVPLKVDGKKVLECHDIWREDYKKYLVQED